MTVFDDAAAADADDAARRGLGGAIAAVRVDAERGGAAARRGVVADDRDRQRERHPGLLAGEGDGLVADGVELRAGGRPSTESAKALRTVLSTA